ncbi:biotin/acetyl-CoA-carboxylase ligase [mine drainage metagenome]|uniref:Biotin/acetyl-CoA-carboxylase ligase n=2 Tax=mine drainage metagenome TaxID=410659 RepID=T1CRM7_9ZZZZ
MLRDPDGIAALVTQLGDGKWHAGPELAHRLGVSRSAVWKKMRTLEAMGLGLKRDRMCGYRLPAGARLLSRERIQAGLRLPAKWRETDIEVLPIVDSTNDRLLRNPSGTALRVCLAEYQTKGRGRRGRSWWGAYGASLLLSWGVRFTVAPPDLQALGLVSALAATRALARAGFPPPGIKWPNDLVYGHAKLGGILVELSGEAGGPLWCVAGLGLNVDAASCRPLATGMAPISLESVAPDVPRDRNVLAPILIEEWLQAVDIFQLHGFRPFQEHFRDFDALWNQPVVLFEQTGTRNGWARGVRSDGALWFETAPGIREALVAGEVSIRFKA